MEKTLCDAAVENNVTTLRQLLGQDSLILDKATLNCKDMNPLHIAAMFGKVEFVKEVLRVSPDMCLAADRFGRIPLHLAVIKGRLPVVQELIHAKPLAARERTDGGGNVLHLCVKYNQLEALKFLVQTIKDEDFANRKDDEGMTILHLAICDKQTETIKYLLDNKIVRVNAKNANGSTGLVLFQGESNSEIAQILECAGAKRGKDIGSSVARNGLQEASHSPVAQGNKWLSSKRDALMVVASLIATMAFQAGLNPPGGVWQDDNFDAPDPHVAGVAVMAYRYPRYYKNFIRANTSAFVSSLSTILFLISGLPFKNRVLLWFFMANMWLTIAAIAITYGISIVILTPPDDTKKLSHAIKTAVILTLWGSVMTLLLLGNTIRLINRWLKRRHGIDLLEKLRHWN